MDKALPIKTQPKRTQPMKTHKAARLPNTPNVACANNMMSLPVMFMILFA